MEYAIIAAGKGERLAEEGLGVPKPLTPLLGTTLIDRLLSLFPTGTSDRISVIVNQQSELLIGHLQESTFPARVIVKDTESSLHSFVELIKTGLGDEVCLTTVDTVFLPEEFYHLIRTFRERKELDGLMAVTTFVDDEKPLYVATDEELFVTSFDDSPSHSTRFVSGGIYCLRKQAMECAVKAVGDGVTRMRNFQRALLEEGLRIAAFPFSKIVDVDHIQDIETAEKFLQNQPSDTKSYLNEKQ